MPNLTTIDLSTLSVNNNQVTTTSLDVAHAFGKQHFHLIKSIENLDCSISFTASHFRVSEYKDSSGKKNKLYQMTKDGFMFLVMGFTGKKAARIKEAYINAFNKMAEQQQKPERIENTVYISEYYAAAMKKLKANQALEKANAHKPKPRGIAYYHAKALGLKIKDY